MDKAVTDDVLVFKWHDKKKPVTAASTDMWINPLTKAKRWSAMKKETIEINQPVVIL